MTHADMRIHWLGGRSGSVRGIAPARIRRLEWLLRGVHGMCGEASRILDELTKSEHAGKPTWRTGTCVQGS